MLMSYLLLLGIEYNEYYIVQPDIFLWRLAINTTANIEVVDADSKFLIEIWTQLSFRFSAGLFFSYLPHNPRMAVWQF